ncbi:Protein SODIUM POTASSIUM ROOT DEFECTIVE 2 [Hirschfeldia incana]|nr:Protein SODIUM POTASSIUM ROOT DEFECTIVE 2 [Hirschfeldia incana]
MKGRMLCASQASTAICSGMDHIPKPTTTTVVDDSGRAIDRHNPIINDGKRSSVDDYIRIPASPADGEISNKTLEIYKGRRSVTARKSTGGGGGAAALFKLITNDLSLARKSFSCVARPASEFTKTPPGSTRYLLGSDPGSLAGSAGQDTVASKSSDGEEIKPSMEEEKTGGGSGGSDQVVVLKVSLHCRGCEAKVRKHLSRINRAEVTK